MSRIANLQKIITDQEASFGSSVIPSGEALVFLGENDQNDLTLKVKNNDGTFTDMIPAMKTTVYSLPKLTTKASVIDSMQMVKMFELSGFPLVKVLNASKEIVQPLATYYDTENNKTIFEFANEQISDSDLWKIMIMNDNGKIIQGYEKITTTIVDVQSQATDNTYTFPLSQFTVIDANGHQANDKFAKSYDMDDMTITLNFQSVQGLTLIIYNQVSREFSVHPNYALKSFVSNVSETLNGSIGELDSVIGDSVSGNAALYTRIQNNKTAQVQNVITNYSSAFSTTSVSNGQALVFLTKDESNNFTMMAKDSQGNYNQIVPEMKTTVCDAPALSLGLSKVDSSIQVKYFTLSGFPMFKILSGLQNVQIQPMTTFYDTENDCTYVEFLWDSVLTSDGWKLMIFNDNGKVIDGYKKLAIKDIVLKDEYDSYSGGVYSKKVNISDFKVINASTGLQVQPASISYDVSNLQMTLTFTSVENLRLLLFNAIEKKFDIHPNYTLNSVFSPISAKVTNATSGIDALYANYTAINGRMNDSTSGLSKIYSTLVTSTYTAGGSQYSGLVGLTAAINTAATVANSVTNVTTGLNAAYAKASSAYNQIFTTTSKLQNDRTALYSSVYSGWTKQGTSLPSGLYTYVSRNNSMLHSAFTLNGTSYDKGIAEMAGAAYQTLDATAHTFIQIHNLVFDQSAGNTPIYSELHSGFSYGGSTYYGGVISKFMQVYSKVGNASSGNDKLYSGLNTRKTIHEQRIIQDYQTDFSALTVSAGHAQVFLAENSDSQLTLMAKKSDNTYAELIPNGKTTVMTMPQLSSGYSQLNAGTTVKYFELSGFPIIKIIDDYNNIVEPLHTYYDTAQVKTVFEFNSDISTNNLWKIIIFNDNGKVANGFAEVTQRIVDLQDVATNNSYTFNMSEFKVVNSSGQQVTPSSVVYNTNLKRITIGFSSVTGLKLIIFNDYSKTFYGQGHYAETSSMNDISNSVTAQSSRINDIASETSAWYYDSASDYSNVTLYSKVFDSSFGNEQLDARVSSIETALEGLNSAIEDILGE